MNWKPLQNLYHIIILYLITQGVELTGRAGMKIFTYSWEILHAETQQNKQKCTRHYVVWNISMHSAGRYTGSHRIPVCIFLWYEFLIHHDTGEFDYTMFGMLRLLPMHMLYVTVHAQLRVSRHIACLCLPQWRLFGKDGILNLPFR